jgi:hypothetical protein
MAFLFFLQVFLFTVIVFSLTRVFGALERSHQICTARGGGLDAPKDGSSLDKYVHFVTYCVDACYVTARPL